MASATHANAVAAPLTRERPRTRRRQVRRARARGGILWIVLSGILLTGVVFVNVAVLRLNISLDSANTQRAKLRAENAALQSQLASEVASQKIQQRARTQFGLVAADPSTTRYLNLAR
jgi:cell division protein FtsL